jgi:hypothetical protein
MSDDLERRTRPISFMVTPGQLVTWCPPGLAREKRRNLGDLQSDPEPAAAESASDWSSAEFEKFKAEREATVAEPGQLGE